MTNLWSVGYCKTVVRWSYTTVCVKERKQVSPRNNLKIFSPFEKNRFLALIFVHGGQDKQHGTELEGKKEGHAWKVWTLPRDKRELRC